MAIDVRWGARTDPGRVRELNEDSLLASPPLFVVADGVGGHAAGEVASGIAVSGLSRFTGSRAVEAPSVIAAVRQVNAEIRTHAAAVSSDRGMGSTVVGLALSWYEQIDTVLLFNVGDSRAFCLSDGVLRQVSQDHTLIDELLRSGRITAEEAQVHPRRGVITRALGAADDVDVDSWHVEARVGDRFLLCSDGLTNEVDVDVLFRVLTDVLDPDDAAQTLIGLALDHGGRDNVTAVVVDIAAVEAGAGAGAVLSTVASPVDGARPDDEPDTTPLHAAPAAPEPALTSRAPAPAVAAVPPASADPPPDVRTTSPALAPGSSSSSSSVPLPPPVGREHDPRP